MHILHFKMSISASKCAIIISFNVVKYDTFHLQQLIGSGLLKPKRYIVRMLDERDFGTSNSAEFGGIANFIRQAEQSGKPTYKILYFHIKIQQCVFSILHKSVSSCPDFCMKVQFTVYLLLDTPAYSARLLNF